VALLLVGALGILVMAYVVGTPQTTVPKVTGQTRSVALKRIAKSDLSAKIIRSHRAERRLPARYAGQIVHQNWRDGVTLPENGVVRLTLYPRAGAKHHARP
jgi:beta-lactam-binding protein with PASTA domain